MIVKMFSQTEVTLGEAPTSSQLNANAKLFHICHPKQKHVWLVDNYSNFRFEATSAS